MSLVRFRFEVLTREGAVRRGTIEASSAAEAAAALRARGEQPLSIAAASSRAADAAGGSSGAPLSGRELELFFSQLARLVAAGLPLARALSALAEGAPGTARGAVGAYLLTVLREGRAPAAAFQAAGFDAGTVALIRSGEAYGDLAPALAEIERLVVARNAFLGRIRAALVYPAILSVVAIGAVLTILLVVIPQFATLVGDRMDRLSTAAAIVFWLSGAVRDYGWVILAVVAALGLVVVHHGRTRSWSGVLVDFLRRIPGGADLVDVHQSAALARLLGALLTRQVGLIPALDISRTVLVDKVVRAAADDVRERLTTGERLGAALAEAGSFPPAVVQLAAVGEETGNLGDLMTRAAQLMEDELDRRAKLFLIWFEPILLIIIGLMIGGLLYGLFSAIFAINDLI